MSVRLFTDEIELQICNLYLSGLSSSGLVKKFGGSECTVINVLKRHNIERRSRTKAQKSYLSRHDYFDKIDTEDKAYWLGFSSDDANIINGQYRLRLAAKDKVHLEKFNACLGSKIRIFEYSVKNTKFKSDKQAVGLVFRSKQVVTSLANLGVGENKSFTLKPCLSMPEKLKKHYLRGLFDGDGCITGHYIRSGKTWQWKASFCGSADVVSYFVGSIGVPIKIGKQDNIFIAQYSSIDSIQTLCKTLYSEATIFLDRKRDLAFEIIENLRGRDKNAQVNTKSN